MEKGEKRVKMRGREGGKVKPCLLQTLAPDKAQVPDVGTEGCMSQSKIIPKLVFPTYRFTSQFPSGKFNFPNIWYLQKASGFDKAVFCLGRIFQLHRFDQIQCCTYPTLPLCLGHLTWKHSEHPRALSSFQLVLRWNFFFFFLTEWGYQSTVPLALFLLGFFLGADIF